MNILNPLSLIKFVLYVTLYPTAELVMFLCGVLSGARSNLTNPNK